MRPIITSKKHYVQTPINTVMEATILNIEYVNAVAEPSAGRDVLEGSIVKAVYIEMWLLAGANQPGSVTVSVEKVPALADQMTFLQGATLTDYPNKKNILFTSQGVIGDANTNPVPFMRQWFKIPKGKQRFGLGDKLVLNIQANTEDITHCGLAVFKEYN